MLNEQTMEKLYALKLLGMAEAFKEQLQQPSIDDLSFADRFGLLVDRQWTFKEDCRMKASSKTPNSKSTPVSRTLITEPRAESINPSS